jgi:hypothetical protein
LPRQFLINLLFTLLGSEFSDWVNAIVEARNLKVATDRKMLLELDPDIAQAFHNSTAVNSKLKSNSRPKFNSDWPPPLHFLITNFLYS